MAGASHPPQVPHRAAGTPLAPAAFAAPAFVPRSHEDTGAGLAAATSAKPWSFGGGTAVPFGTSGFGQAPVAQSQHSVGVSSSEAGWSAHPAQDAPGSVPAASAWAQGTFGPVVAPTPRADKPLAFAALPGISLGSAALGDDDGALPQHANVDMTPDCRDSTGRMRSGSACAVSDPDDDVLRVLEETGIGSVLDFDMDDSASVGSLARMSPTATTDMDMAPAGCPAPAPHTATDVTPLPARSGLFMSPPTWSVSADGRTPLSAVAW